MRALQTVATVACLGLGAGVIGAKAQLQGAASQHGPTSTLPAKTPTQSVTVASSVQNSATRVREIKLEVVFVGRSLTVRAENASLGQILRDISQKTGIKVSGSAGEERVFGNYGPASTAVVLSSLLEGTGSNVLLVDNKTGPQELFLTPRGGRATAPSQSASMQNSSTDAQEPEQQYVAPVQPFRPPGATGRGPVGANQDGTPAFNQPADDNDGATVIGGGQQRTPQQIYEQLQSLSNQQQQQQQQNPPE